MQNFEFHVPTRICFGKGEISKLGKAIKEYGSRVLLVYSGGSIKRIGLYDEVIKILNENNIYYQELGGVNPNPRITSVEAGVKICKEHNIDVLLPVGGGSTIDCAKVIAACVNVDTDDYWGVVKGDVKMTTVLPVISVLTIAATGSEMDPFAVITNLETNEKLGTAHPDMRPKVSIMDPTYTMSVPQNHTAAGTADIICHTLENYFNNEKGAYLQARFGESVLKTCFKYGTIAYNEPNNYEARANLMWANSWAINGLCSRGCDIGWSCHSMEHELSAYYDIIHGVGLAILMPHWLRYMMRDENLWKYVEFGVNVFGIDPSLDDRVIANQAIDIMADYFKELHLPQTLREVGIDDSKFELMADHIGSLEDAFIPLSHEDIVNIYKLAL